VQHLPSDLSLLLLPETSVFFLTRGIDHCGATEAHLLGGWSSKATKTAPGRCCAHGHRCFGFERPFGLRLQLVRCARAPEPTEVEGGRGSLCREARVRRSSSWSLCREARVRRSSSWSGGGGSTRVGRVGVFVLVEEGTAFVLSAHALL